MRKTNKKAALRVAVNGILGSVALTLSFLESMIPDVAFLPPGTKLGLSNIAVMFAAMVLGLGDGLFIVILKSGFVFLTRGAASFFMSFSGGILSYLVLALIIIISSKLKREFSYIGISVICAVMHNAGQIAAASVYTSTNLVYSYMPLLIITGIIFGTVNGIILKTVMPALYKLQQKFPKRG